MNLLGFYLNGELFDFNNKIMEDTKLTAKYKYLLDDMNLIIKK